MAVPTSVYCLIIGWVLWEGNTHLNNFHSVEDHLVLFANQSWHWSASSWSEVNAVEIDPSLLGLGYFLSSVNVALSIYLILWCLVWKSFTITRNRSVARLVSWGMPPFIFTQDDMMSPILTLCFLLARKDALLARKDASHLTRQPCTSRSKRLHKTIRWSTWPTTYIAWVCKIYKGIACVLWEYKVFMSFLVNLIVACIV